MEGHHGVDGGAPISWDFIAKTYGVIVTFTWLKTCGYSHSSVEPIYVRSIVVDHSQVGIITVKVVVNNDCSL